jgi:poly[(R)-3-hydroxyalkanoate] polymerase subunit PhaC
MSRPKGTSLNRLHEPQPADVVWRRGPATLLRYKSASSRLEGERCGLPVVLVPSLINRAAILDLRPGQSLVEHLLGAGLDVYLVDWGEPSSADAHLDLKAYALRLLPSALQAARRESGADSVHVFGYCLGGTLGLIAAAARPAGIASLLTLTTPVDLSETGSMGVLTDARLLNLERLIRAWPVIPGPALWTAFQALDPTGNLRKARRYKQNDDPDYRARFEAQEAWLNDPVPATAKAIRDVVQLYRSNSLARGNMVLGGRLISLAKGRAPVLNLIADYDTIVPRSAAEALGGLWGGEVTTRSFRAGHIGVTVGRRAPDELWAEVTTWLLKGRA